MVTTRQLYYETKKAKMSKVFSQSGTIYTEESIKGKLISRFNLSPVKREYFAVFRKALIIEKSPQAVKEMEALITAMFKARGVALNSAGVAQKERRWLKHESTKTWCKGVSKLNLNFVEMLANVFDCYAMTNRTRSSFSSYVSQAEAVINTGEGKYPQTPHSDMGSSDHWKNQDLDKITYRQSGSLFLSLTDNSDIYMRRYVKGRPRYKKVVLNAGDALFMSSHQVHCGTTTRAAKLFYSFSLDGYRYDGATHQEWNAQYSK